MTYRSTVRPSPTAGAFGMGTARAIHPGPDARIGAVVGTAPNAAQRRSSSR